MDFSDLAPGPAPQLPLEAYAARRQRVAAKLEDDQCLVVATHPETTYSNDVENPFRPHNDFWYLTGFNEPGAAVMIDAAGETTLFLRDREPSAEIWTGRRLGVARARDALGVDVAHPLDDFGTVVADQAAGRRIVAQVDHNPWIRRRLLRVAGGPKRLEDASPLLVPMRLIKDEAELDLMRKAAAIGCEAMREGAAVIRPGGHEFEVEAALLAAYRRAGSTGPGYPPIVGTGANAAVLHYISNQAAISAGDLVLVDAGCEWGYYNSDITRTFPASGEWSETQRRLYDLVDAAHRAAIRQVRPGNKVRDPHRAAVRVLATGLVDLGYIDGPAETAMETGAFQRFFMHGTSHFLGLDVHDVGGRGDARLEPGMVITVEPGLYFNSDFTPCPDEAVGIGIRIESDVAVTADGCEVLTEALPTDADAVAAMVGS